MVQVRMAATPHRVLDIQPRGEVGAKRCAAVRAAGRRVPARGEHVPSGAAHAPAARRQLIRVAACAGLAMAMTAVLRRVCGGFGAAMHELIAARMHANTSCSPCPPGGSWPMPVGVTVAICFLHTVPPPEQRRRIARMLHSRQGNPAIGSRASSLRSSQRLPGPCCQLTLNNTSHALRLAKMGADPLRAWQGAPGPAQGALRPCAGSGRGAAVCMHLLLQLRATREPRASRLPRCTPPSRIRLGVRIVHLLPHVHARVREHAR